MKSRAAICAVVFTALLLTPTLALTQPAPPTIGAEVKDQKGASVGRVEKIILGPDGRPKQALIRVDRVLRALPVEALQPSASGYVAVLTRAEIAALPPAD